MGGLGAKGGHRGQTTEEPMLMIQHHASRPHHDEYMAKKVNNNTEDYQESAHLHERTSFMVGNYTKSISSQDSKPTYQLSSTKSKAIVRSPTKEKDDYQPKVHGIKVQNIQNK